MEVYKALLSKPEIRGVVERMQSDKYRPISVDYVEKSITSNGLWINLNKIHLSDNTSELSTRKSRFMTQSSQEDIFEFDEFQGSDISFTAEQIEQQCK